MKRRVISAIIAAIIAVPLVIMGGYSYFAGIGVLAILAYRELRTEQAYISKIANTSNSRYIREQLADLDKDRREKHNLALTELKGLNRFAKDNGLEPIYKGKELSEEEIERHDNASYDIRMEMTDAFLKILLDLGKYTVKENTKSKEEIRAIQKDMDKVAREYGVKQELENDDGDILFDDFEKGRF